MRDLSREQYLFYSYLFFKHWPFLPYIVVTLWPYHSGSQPAVRQISRFKSWARFLTLRRNAFLMCLNVGTKQGWEPLPYQIRWAFNVAFFSFKLFFWLNLNISASIHLLVMNHMKKSKPDFFMKRRSYPKIWYLLLTRNRGAFASSKNEYGL